MKQIYLHPLGGRCAPLRSDTLFGLLAWGVREVYGRKSVERFLEPISRDPPVAPLTLTSAFPYVETEAGRRHHFPRPLAHPDQADGDDASSPWIEQSELVSFVTGGSEAPTEPSPPTGESGLFFLAEGPGDHYLEAALGFLERFGFGGGGSTGRGAYSVELVEAEFLRQAVPGEQGLLLSLYAPTSSERAAIRDAIDGVDGGGVRYAVERRRGFIGGRLLPSERAEKQPVVMMREGLIVPVTGPGSAPVVGEADDGDGSFAVVQHGFGFFVPVTGAPSP